MTRRLPITLLAAALLVLLAACGGAGDADPSTPTPTPSVGPVTTPEAAVAAVIAHEPRLSGIGPLDLELIGQSSWYEVMPASGVGAFLVSVRVGWGDCPAGCIDEHSWVYAVGPDGRLAVGRRTAEARVNRVRAVDVEEAPYHRFSSATTRCAAPRITATARGRSSSALA